MLVAKSLSYDGNDGALFDNVDVTLDSAAKKRVAIVGRNGCGKSTLLNLLRGALLPRSGSVTCSREVIGFLPQDIVFPDLTVLAGAYLESKLEEEWMSYKIEMGLEQVGLPADILLTELGKLSGGQKVRIALVEILLLEPTILMMDEPTNHLDPESVAWLKGFAKDFDGTVVFVSHDRDFINSVADQILEITGNKKIESYGMNYDKFLIERYNRYQKALSLYEYSQREYVELEMWLRENANHPKYKFTSTVAQKKKALERMEKGIPPEPVADPRVHMHDLDDTIKGNVLTLKIEQKSFGDKEILKDLELRVESSERIRIEGPNGSGKTTLLNIIAGADKDFKGSLKLRNPDKVGYLKQFSSLNPENSVIDEFSDRTMMDYTLARTILAKYLFPADMIDEKIKRLSYGQQRRLELAILIANKPDVLLLDEPTNHLDIFLREDLEQYLVDQNVAMIIISHDEYFVEKLNISRVISL
jgi:ATPase subunit of ABC transporter with duplicated ATPase domains